MLTNRNQVENTKQYQTLGLNITRVLKWLVGDRSSLTHALPQWESSYISEIQPFCIPYNVSGVDYRSAERWRRTAADAPAVSSTDFTRGAARRVEGQTRSDWSFVPLLRSLHFRWSSVTAVKLDVERGIRAHVPADDPVTDLIKAPQSLCNKLWQRLVWAISF